MTGVFLIFANVVGEPGFIAIPLTIIPGFPKLFKILGTKSLSPTDEPPVITSTSF